MKTTEYKDGLAFMTDDEMHEIAFYSRFTDRISYSHHNGYKDFVSIGCVEIPYKDNFTIVEEVRRYKRCLESRVI